ncbi:MAG TPA: type II toxin-antitoxin system VapC family toxin [Candidatus Kapabacteria bacterium]|jgi:predicted nucleic acid-binding protein
MKNFVLDSHAFLAFLNKENGWEKVLSIISEAQQSEIKLPMSAINWGEILYQARRKDGVAGAIFIEEHIQDSAIEIILPTLEHVRKAAELKSYRVSSYADCFAAALALELDLPVLTGDPEFKSLEEYGVKVEWLPQKR